MQVCLTLSTPLGLWWIKADPPSVTKSHAEALQGLEGDPPSWSRPLVLKLLVKALHTGSVKEQKEKERKKEARQTDKQRDRIERILMSTSPICMNVGMYL